MTINVAVKCPEGLVLGADSLVSIVGAQSDPFAGERPQLQAFAPRHRKLFQVARLPVGVLLNGDTIIGGQTVEDVVAEFGAEYVVDVGEPGTRLDLADLSERLREFVAQKIGAEPSPGLQLIVAGYSRGKVGVRCGEVFTLTWDRPSPARPSQRDGSLRHVYAKDREFGVTIGGQPDPVYRFLYGFDRPILTDIANRKWAGLYDRILQYVLDALRRGGVTIPPEMEAPPVPSVLEVQPWSLLSRYDYPADPEAEQLDADDIATRAAEHSNWKQDPLYAFFSLPMAIDFTWHLLQIAYLESNYFMRLPVVGSRLTIATITRDDGFKVEWSGESGVPSHG